MKSALGLRELICSLAIILMAGGIYALLIHPSILLVAERSEAINERREAEAGLRETNSRYARIQEEILKGKAILEELGGAPPVESEKDVIISRLAGLANESSMTIDQYSPIGRVLEHDHMALFVQFTGRGSYESVFNCLERIESEIEFVDITHFTLSSIRNAREPDCTISWSCRISVMREKEMKPERKAARTPEAGPVTEVAIREP